MTACKNCTFEFEGKFCPNCAQKADTHRFTLGHFLHDVFHAMTHTDKGVIHLIKAMATRPGYVAKEYNQGKRKKYFNPITFLLIMSAAQIFFSTKTDFFGTFTRATQEYTTKMLQNSGKYTEAQIRELVAKNDQSDAVTKATNNSKLLTFLFIPVLALLTWLFFRKSGYNFAENLVMHVFVVGHLSLYFLPVCVIPFLFAPSYVVLWFTLYFILNIAYTMVAYKQFFGQGWGWTIVKGLTIQVVYLVAAQLLTTLVFKII
jgi:hypothetical protein